MDQIKTENTQEKRKILWNSSVSRHNKYINRTTGLFDAKFIEDRHCPVCQKNSSRFLFHRHGGTYVKCTDCEMIYLNPVFKDEYLNEFYSTNHAVQSQIVEEDLSFYHSIYSKGLDLIKENRSAHGALLDYGCSSGVFLDLAKKSGFKTYGIELNQAERTVAKSKGHQIFEQDIRSLAFEQTFDVITLWDVFEHLKDGFTYLAHFKNILSPQGILFMQIPNGFALAAQVLQEKCNMFDGLEHVNLFNHRNIKALAERAGFKVIGMKSVISEKNVLSNYLNFEEPYSDLKTYSQLFDVISESAILDQLLGYKLQVAFKI